MRPIRIALFTIVMVATRVVVAGESCCAVRCPCCEHVCQLSIDEVKKVKYCWQVQCEPVCIPPVTFPWQKCGCTPKCAAVRYVRRLKRVEYECPTCECTWTPVWQGCCAAAPEGCDRGPVNPPPIIFEEDAAPAPPPGPTASRPSLTSLIGRLFRP